MTSATERLLAPFSRDVVDANDDLIAVGEYYAVVDAEEAEVAFTVADALHSEVHLPQAGQKKWPLAAG